MAVLNANQSTILVLKNLFFRIVKSNDAALFVAVDYAALGEKCKSGFFLCYLWSVVTVTLRRALVYIPPKYSSINSGLKPKNVRLAGWWLFRQTRARLDFWYINLSALTQEIYLLFFRIFQKNRYISFFLCLWKKKKKVLWIIFLIYFF